LGGSHVVSNWNETVTIKQKKEKKSSPKGGDVTSNQDWETKHYTKKQITKLKNKLQQQRSEEDLKDFTDGT